MNIDLSNLPEISDNQLAYLKEINSHEEEMYKIDSSVQKDAEDLGFSIDTDEDQKARDLGYLSSRDPNYQSMLANDDYYNMGIRQ